MDYIKYNFSLLIAWLSGHNADKEKKLEHYKDVSTVAILGILCTVIFAAYSLLYFTVFPCFELALIELFCSVAATMTLLFYRKFEAYEKTMIAYTFYAYLATFASCYYTGGIKSPHIYWCVAIILGSELFASKAIAKWSFRLLVLGLITYILIAFFKIKLPESIFEGVLGEIYSIATIFLICICILSFGRLYRSILSKSLNELKFKNERIRRFVGILCHDIANPLTVILARAQMGEKRNWKLEKNKEVYAKIVQTSYVIKDILNYVRQIEDLNNQDVIMNLENIEINSILNCIKPYFEESLSKKNISIVINHTQSDGVYIEAIEKKLKYQVIFSIIENAIKFSYDNSDINISTTVNGELLEIKISDKGMGIPKEIRDEILKIDVKTTTLGAHGEQGTGFGLPLAYSYLKKFGGDLQIDTTYKNSNELSHGTTIKVFLKIIRPS